MVQSDLTGNANREGRAMAANLLAQLSLRCTEGHRCRCLKILTHSVMICALSSACAVKHGTAKKWFDCSKLFDRKT